MLRHEIKVAQLGNAKTDGRVISPKKDQIHELQLVTLPICNDQILIK